MSLNPLRRRSVPDGGAAQGTLEPPVADRKVIQPTVTETRTIVPEPGVSAASATEPAGQVVSDRVVSDKVVSDKVGSEKVGSDPVVIEKPVTDQVVTERPVTEKVVTEKVVTGPVVVDKPVVDKVVTEPGADGPVVLPDRVEDVVAVDRASVVAREKEAFGGVKIVCAFFGWLTATGTAVLLTALIAAAGTAIGVASGAQSALAVQTTPTTGTRADVAIIAVMLVGYYCGGYVAGRMARFNGIKQGVAVWVWGLLTGVVIAALAGIAGSRFDLLATLNGFPRLSTYQGQVGHAVVTVLIAIAAALLGATLGGLAGMRFHRRVDKAGLGR